VAPEVVGIARFLNSEVGVPGVVKQRYADFLVHEVSLEGEVAILTDLAKRPSAKRSAEASAGAGPESKRTRLEGGAAESAAAALQRRTEEGVARFVAAVGDDANVEPLRALVAAARADRTRAPSESVVLPYIDDKARRTAVHHAMRDCFPELDTDAVPQEQRDGVAASEGGSDGGSEGVRAKPLMCIRIFGAGPKGRKVRRTKPVWEGGECDHVRFAMHKFNMETHDALETCARFSYAPRSKFSFAGTKDKRGITTQWVTAYKVTPAALAKVNGRIPCLWVGAPTYVKAPLRVGGLGGNRFTIVLRDIPFELSETVIGASVDAWAKLGFINYFGLQRFGTTSVPTHAVGRALIKGDWKGAVDTILMPRKGDWPDIAKARQLWIDGDAEGALRGLPFNMVRERGLLKELLAKGRDEETGEWRGAEEALNSVPYTLRTMYCHGYQSCVALNERPALTRPRAHSLTHSPPSPPPPHRYVWNRIVSQRLDTFGAAPVVGDLVVCPPTAEQAAAQHEAQAAHDAKEAEKSADGNKRRWPKRLHVPTHVRALTAEDVAAGTYTLADVTAPLPGFDVTYPPNMRDAYAAIMAEDGITRACAVRAYAPGARGEKELIASHRI
jgi:tRNA pseudouridine13 synthase